MTMSKLLKRVFKRTGTKTTAKNDSAATLSSNSPSSTLPPPIKQQLPKNLESCPQSGSPFFSLPGELRNNIYFHVIYPSLSTISIFKNMDPVFSPNVFHICRRMRSEAIAHLCASKPIYLSGIRTANAFFNLVRDELPSLRHVTVRCEEAWRMEVEEVEVEKKALLDMLGLATGLKTLTFIVGEHPLDVDDKVNIEDSRSVGAQFLYAVRDVVDGEICEVQKERAIKYRYVTLCDQMGAEEARRSFKKKLGEEHEQREDKVFRLCKMTGPWGVFEKLELPLRLPEYLRKSEESSGRT